MREVQQKPSWNEQDGRTDEAALRSLRALFMIERRPRWDFSIDAILNCDF